jgi:hypothetical protein
MLKKRLVVGTNTATSVEMYVLLCSLCWRWYRSLTTMACAPSPPPPPQQQQQEAAGQVPESSGSHGGHQHGSPEGEKPSIKDSAFRRLKPSQNRYSLLKDEL